jgi:hypothetical protein
MKKQGLGLRDLILAFAIVSIELARIDIPVSLHSAAGGIESEGGILRTPSKSACLLPPRQRA